MKPEVVVPAVGITAAVVGLALFAYMTWKERSGRESNPQTVRPPD